MSWILIQFVTSRKLLFESYEIKRRKNSVPHNPRAFVGSSTCAASSGRSGSMEPRHWQEGSYHTRAQTQWRGGEHFCFLARVTQRTEKSSKVSIQTFFKRLKANTWKKKKTSVLCSITIIAPEILFSSFFPEAVRMTLTSISHYLLYPTLLSHATTSLAAASQFPCSWAFPPPFPLPSFSHLFASFPFPHSPVLKDYCTGSPGKHCCDIIFLPNINKEIIIWHPAAELEANPIDFSRRERLFEPTALHCLATCAPSCLRLLWWWLSNAALLSKRWSRASAILTPQLQGFPPLPRLLFGNTK